MPTTHPLSPAAVHPSNHLMAHHPLPNTTPNTLPNTLPNAPSPRPAADFAVEAAAQELEARLALLRQYSNWRLNTR